MDIEPGRILNDFIEPNKKQYVIPVYQRNYEWSEVQCKKLFDDIILAFKKDRKHFCGSFVYSQLKEEHNINYYIIIDGQQRLTTIYILLKALLDCSDSEKDKDNIKEALFNRDKYDEYGIDVQSKLKLKPIKSDNRQLMLLMEDKFDDASVDKSSDIWSNYANFSKYIKEQIDQGITIRDIYRGIEKLTCAKIKLNEEDNAQEIFERINSTGVPLSLADKIRNYVLMTDIDQEKLYEDYWIKIEQLISKDYMESFFIDYLNLKNDKFTKFYDAYDTFKEYYINNNFSNEEMLAELLHYASLYHAFLYGDNKYSDAINRGLKDLQRLNQTTVFTFLFRLFDDYEEGLMDQDELARILQLLLNYSIRRLTCEISSNSLRGLYKTLYARIFSYEGTKEHYYDSIVSFLTTLKSRDVFPSDDEFAYSLKENNLYRKNALCKYLLSSIENQGKEQVVTDNVTIEHVLPQNKNLSTNWQNMLGENWQEIQEKCLHTLGNLTLTGYNSELGDRPFLDKKKELADGKSKFVILYKEINKYDYWNEETIKSRANILSNTILKLFPLPTAQYVFEFKDKRFKEYSCDDPNIATYKVPNYYVLQGERITIDSFAHMLKSVIEKLYEKEPEIIKNMARNNDTVVPWSKIPLLSYDSNATVGADHKLLDSGIYQSTGFSAKRIVAIIKELLDRCGIDNEEFVYSARQNTPIKH